MIIQVKGNDKEFFYDKIGNSYINTNNINTKAFLLICSNFNYSRDISCN